MILPRQRVMVQDGRIFAAADRSAGLKIGAVFLPLRTIVSSGDLRVRVGVLRRHRAGR